MRKNTSKKRSEGEGEMAGQIQNTHPAARRGPPLRYFFSFASLGLRLREGREASSANAQQLSTRSQNAQFWAQCGRSLTHSAGQ